MNNQAAQTMPVIDDFNGDNAKLIESARALISLSDSGSLAHHGIGGHARAILSAFIVRTEAAALSQTAGVPDGGLEDFTDYFVKNYPGPNKIIYDPKWHAPRIFRAAQRAIQAAAPAASGVHPDALPDGTLSKSTAKRVTALAAASVSERARGYHQHDAIEFAVRDLGYSPADAARITAAVEQALTQQRGDDVESAARALFEAQADPLAASWDRQWGPTKELWRKVARGNLYATTPQPSADAVRELVKRWRIGASLCTRQDYGDGARDALNECADELESMLSGGSHA